MYKPFQNDSKDGEGATKLIEVIAEGAMHEEDAYKVVSSIAKSPLVKTAIFGKMQTGEGLLLQPGTLEQSLI